MRNLEIGSSFLTLGLGVLFGFFNVLSAILDKHTNQLMIQMQRISTNPNLFY